ncbi:PadR family transcriptional regulator [Sphaerisporangium aureirubrum]|uniref:PadR family transcriptional regulator n=1 Tax=Sphaerisporangium aureirubrum TaxID=1544736 RepID=A0ABW1NK93_9ACTN
MANPLALAVLAWLLTEPMHPYELGRRLRRTGQDRYVKYSRGSLYMVVDQLRRAGFIAERETVRDTRRPERTVYTLTDAGRAEFHEWMRDLIGTPRQEYPQFGVALSLLGALAPEEVAALLRHRLLTLTTLAGELRAGARTAAEGGLSWPFPVEDEYRLAVLEAERRFVARLVDTLSAGGLPAEQA